jgi:hypothetical protein
MLTDECVKDRGLAPYQGLIGPSEPRMVLARRRGWSAGHAETAAEMLSYFLGVMLGYPGRRHMAVAAQAVGDALR